MSNFASKTALLFLLILPQRVTANEQGFVTGWDLVFRLPITTAHLLLIVEISTNVPLSSVKLITKEY